MRAAAAVTLMLLAGGCDQLFNLDHVLYQDDLPVPDASVPKLIDAPSQCDGTFVGHAGLGDAGLLRVCVPTTVTSSVTLSGAINTDSSCDAVLAIDASVDVCVKWAKTMSVTGIQTRGARPLVLVATDSLNVDGLIDVAAHIGGNIGGGSNPASCPAPDGANNLLGGAGGGGGSFGTQGGNGGPNAQGQHGQARAAEPGDRVRGGCNGGRGGVGATSASDGGNGGAAGGAIYLMAATSISFGASTVVNASGAGGHGGGSSGSTYAGGGGGGGGGAGGLIGLDAPMITISTTAIFVADGGGGGAGGTNTAGTNGSDPSTTAIHAPAPGGTGYLSAGGAGAVGTAPGSAGNSGKSSGGGGGGVGYIRYFSSAPLTGGNFSPPAM